MQPPRTNQGILKFQIFAASTMSLVVFFSKKQRKQEIKIAQYIMKIMIIDDTCHGHLICRYMCWILSQFGTYWYTLVHIGTYSRKLLQTDTRMYAGMPDTITDFFSHIIFLYLCFAYFPCICLMLMACTDRDLPPRDFGIIFHLPEVR